jgi:Ca2+-binding EF-hand superfamily protein
MRWKQIVGASMLLVLCTMLFSPAWGQFPGQFGGKKKGGFGPGGGGFAGGGFGGGGFGGGGFGGGGNPFGGGFGGNRDPNAMFDFLAKGRPFFLTSETRMLREPLEKYLESKSITNGQVTRELFAQYNEQMKTSMTAIGNMNLPNFRQAASMMAPSQDGGAGGFGAGRMNPVEMMNQWADAEFNRRDGNGDGYLNTDEMPDALRVDLARWDTNHDGLIDRNEFRAYFLARFAQGGDARQANPVTIILEEEFDKRPTVLRAGKLPKELKWFSDLDIDKDGQIALWEWRQAGKSIEEFQSYDRNDDGFITPEEALRVMNVRNGNGRNHAEDGDDEGVTASVSRSAPPEMSMFNRGNWNNGGEDKRGGKQFDPNWMGKKGKGPGGNKKKKDGGNGGEY